MWDKPVVHAADLMERDVLTVSPDTRALDLHALFVEHEIHGAPVVGSDRTVQGVVSTIDLLRIVRDEIEPGARATTTTYFHDELPCADPDWLRIADGLRDRMRALKAADVMTRELVMIRPGATVDQIVEVMSEHRVHRVLVGERRLLQGLITTFDLLRVLSRVLPLYEDQTQYAGYHRGESK